MKPTPRLFDELLEAEKSRNKSKTYYYILNQMEKQMIKQNNMKTKKQL
jgi:hypothetical protein